MDDLNKCMICYENKNTLKICPNLKCNYEMCGDCDSKNGNKCPFCRFDKSVIIISPKCHICNNFESMFIKNEGGNRVCLNCYNIYTPCRSCRNDTKKTDLKDEICNDCYENKIDDYLEKFKDIRKILRDEGIFSVGRFIFYSKNIMLCNDDRIKHIKNYLINLNKSIKEFDEIFISTD